LQIPYNVEEPCADLLVGLTFMIGDVRTRLDELAEDPSDITDPFVSIYNIVFALTMRMVACKELVENRQEQLKVLRLYEQVEASSTPMTIMYPWFPSLGKIKRTWGGYQIYSVFNKIVAAREREGRREDDPFQCFLDRGENVLMLITVRSTCMMCLAI